MKRIADKTCPTCKKNVHGRKDKVFCELKCKDIHRELEIKQTSEIQHLNDKGVIRNCVILTGILGYKYKSVDIHRDLLFKHGFNIDKFISKRYHKGIVVYCLPSFEFMLLKNGIVRILRLKRRNKQLFIKEFLDRWELEFPEGVRMSWGVLEGGMRIFFKRRLHHSKLRLSDMTLFSVRLQLEIPPS